MSVPRTMKAVVLVDHGKVGIVDLPVPSPGPGQALVRVNAAALNRRDYWITQGLYPNIIVGKILGSDACGRVVKVGSESDANGWLDQEVVIDPTFDWGPEQHTHANTMKILGVPIDGTLAEYVLVPVDHLAKKPPHLDALQAAALPLAGVTAYRAVFKQGAFQPGWKVLVTGIGGGVAPFVAQFARLGGASDVYVTSSDDKKTQWAINHLGAKDGANYTTDSWEKELRAKAGMFDLVVDSGGGSNVEKYQRLLKPGGRFVSIGGTTLQKPVIDIFRLFLQQQVIIGTSMGSPQDWKEMVDFVQHHRLVPIVYCVRPFNEAIEAIASMKTNAGQLGKIVIDLVAGSGSARAKL